MPIELRFAEGKISKLPDYIPALPKWAMVAARFAADGLYKPIKHLKPIPGQKYEVGDLIELMGHLEAMVAYVHNPSKEVRQLEEEARP